MTLKLEISRELETELRTEASRLGLPISEYALQVLATRQAPIVMPKTGRELTTYWQDEGLVGTRPEISDSVEHARAMRRKAEKRVRA